MASNNSANIEADLEEYYAVDIDWALLPNKLHNVSRLIVWPFVLFHSH